VVSSDTDMALLVHLLACIFGTGSWVAINGLWVELPLIVNELPEGWDLPSYLTVIIQLANVGPVLVTLLHKFTPGQQKEIVIIYIIVSIGIIASFLLAFLWRETTLIAEELHSTAFLVITFFLSLVDCTSSVTFLPFMMQLPPKYVTTYFIGEGLSGFLPGIVALGQGVGMAKCVNVSQTTNITNDNWTEAVDVYLTEAQYQPPNFSIEVFFFVLTAMMFFCLVAFGFLTRISRKFSPSSKRLVPDQTIYITSIESEKTRKDHWHQDPAADLSAPKAKYSLLQFLFIYLTVAWVNALTNGVLPSVQTYSCMPYGNTVYHLSAALGSMANPLACVIAMFLPNRSLLLLGSLSVAGTGFGAYNLAMAALSPCPLLHSFRVGGAIIVFSWILFIGTLSYVKVMIGVILRDESHSALVWCGAAVQLGSMVGALVMFPLVNVYYLFKPGDPCNTQCPL
uniref:Riboflavin transporter n=1 Tax=Latimeria chalumnae TaxID=7897 RepID=H3AXC1_LATCH